jgi:cytochrome c-type biogenesis protein CcmH
VINNKTPLLVSTFKQKWLKIAAKWRFSLLGASFNLNIPSFPRRRESNCAFESIGYKTWIPAYAGMTGILRCSLFALWLTALSASQIVAAQIQQPAPPLPSPELAQRLKKLESELRCLVCQNQTLAESPAGLAGDLRREVRLLIEQGKSDDEIKTFLQARYGDFVLYKPPVDRKTWLLWFGPFLLLGGGGMLLLWMIRQRKRLAALPINPSANDETLKRARKILQEDSDDRR